MIENCIRPAPDCFRCPSPSPASAGAPAPPLAGAAVPGEGSPGHAAAHAGLREARPGRRGALPASARPGLRRLRGARPALGARRGQKAGLPLARGSWVGPGGCPGSPAAAGGRVGARAPAPLALVTPAAAPKESARAEPAASPRDQGRRAGHLPRLLSRLRGLLGVGAAHTGPQDRRFPPSLGFGNAAAARPPLGARGCARGDSRSAVSALGPAAQAGFPRRSRARPRSRPAAPGRGGAGQRVWSPGVPSAWPAPPAPRRPEAPHARALAGPRRPASSEGGGGRGK